MILMKTPVRFVLHTHPRAANEEFREGDGIFPYLIFCGMHRNNVANYWRNVKSYRLFLYAVSTSSVLIGNLLQ